MGFFSMREPQEDCNQHNLSIQNIRLVEEEISMLASVFSTLKSNRLKTEE